MQSLPTCVPGTVVCHARTCGEDRMLILSSSTHSRVPYKYSISVCAGMWKELVYYTQVQFYLTCLHWKAYMFIVEYHCQLACYSPKKPSELCILVLAALTNDRRPGGLNNTHLFPMVLEAVSPRSGSQLRRVLVRPFPWCTPAERSWISSSSY